MVELPAYRSWSPLGRAPPSSPMGRSLMQGVQVVNLACMIRVVLDHRDRDEPAGLFRLVPVCPAQPKQLGVVSQACAMRASYYCR
jgi:hypothetical protein